MNVPPWSSSPPPPCRLSSRLSLQWLRRSSSSGARCWCSSSQCCIHAPHLLFAVCCCCCCCCSGFVCAIVVSASDCALFKLALPPPLLLLLLLLMFAIAFALGRICRLFARCLWRVACASAKVRNTTLASALFASLRRASRWQASELAGWQVAVWWRLRSSLSTSSYVCANEYPRASWLAGWRASGNGTSDSMRSRCARALLT